MVTWRGYQKAAAANATLVNTTDRSEKTRREVLLSVMAVLQTRVYHDKAVKTRLTSFHDAKYTNKTIQNEVQHHG